MAPLALPHCLGLPYWHHQLVLICYPHQPESHQLSLQNTLVVSELETSGPIDRTPGTPGSDKNRLSKNSFALCILLHIVNLTQPLLIFGIFAPAFFFGTFDSIQTVELVIIHTTVHDVIVHQLHCLRKHSDDWWDLRLSPKPYLWYFQPGGQMIMTNVNNYEQWVPSN